MELFSKTFGFFSYRLKEGMDARERVLAATILILGLSSTLLGFGYINWQLEEHRTKEFEWVAHNRNSALRKGIEDGLEAVKALRDIFETGADALGRETFHRYADTLLNRHPGIRALIWAPAIPRHEQNGHERQYGTDWSGYRIIEQNDDGRLVTVGKRPVYYPTLFVEPRNAQGEILGFDHGSEPKRRSLLEQASQRGELAVSGRIRLIKESGYEYGFMGAISVFHPKPAVGSREVKGFIIGLFRIAELANHSISLLEPRGVEFLISDQSAPEGERFLDFYASRLSHPDADKGRPDPWGGWEQPDAIKFTESFGVADRSWAITCSPTLRYRSAISFQEGPWVILGGGLSLTLLFMVYTIQTRASIRLRDEMAQEIGESEQKLRVLFNQSPDIIMTVDQEGCILLTNRSSSDDSLIQAVGQCSVDAIPESFQEWYRSALNRVFQTGEMAQTQYTRADASWWEIRIVPLRAEGVVTSAMVIATKVTEKRILEAQAIRNARLASLGVLSASVAHEINNPNNAIHFNASILARSFPDIGRMLKRFREEHGEFAIGGVPSVQAIDKLPLLLDGISRSSRRIQDIIANLKHLARHDPGDLSAPVDIHEALRAAVSILQNQITKHTDRFSLVMPKRLPPVRGNAQQLEQVFINLIVNALQSLPDRSAEVVVTAEEEHDEKGGGVRVAVLDRGRGIPEEEIDRAFDPFYTTKDDIDGTGLGLSISRRIIENHEGFIGLDNREGGGVEAVVRLPALPVHTLKE